jgi:hypothetical protein
VSKRDGAEGIMGRNALGLAKLIFEAEPDAALGEPTAVERVTLALAKVAGAILASTLLREGEVALADAVTKVGNVMEQEARRTAGMMRALEDDSGDPPDTIN